VHCGYMDITEGSSAVPRCMVRFMGGTNGLSYAGGGGGGGTVVFRSELPIVAFAETTFNDVH
jgi:hypothetical protein